MSIPHLTACAAVLLAALAGRAATPADAPAKLRTQSVKLRVAADRQLKRDRSVELVQLPPGKITLRRADGKDHEHEVKPIWIARYETRWDEYDVFYQGLDLTDAEMRRQRGWGGGEYAERTRRAEAWERARTAPPYSPPDGGLGRDGFPSRRVHFRAAAKYCAWLSGHTGKRFRLPTEAEWEYACRAGGGPVRPDAKALDKLAWFKDNAEDVPHPVGEKEPNAWGLYDMLGNVGEFVVRDPRDDKGLLAGGSYKDAAKDVHSGAREPYSPDWQKNDPQDPKDTDWLDYDDTHQVGFRVVMEE